LTVSASMIIIRLSVEDSLTLSVVQVVVDIVLSL